MRKDAVRDLGGRFEGSDNRLAIPPAGGLDDAGEQLGIAPNQFDAFTPQHAQPSGHLRLDDEFFKEGSGERGAERRDTASTEPGTPAGDLL